MGTELPTGTVTFLFTDLESSTRLWEEQPEAMQAALTRHDELLTRAVEGAEGQVIKTTGDGFHAVFATADTAVAAAVGAQQALAAEAWSATEPLRVRMGLHTGRAELRGGDYFGPTLNRAARVMAIGHGGQILCSQATADLARDGLSEGVGLRDLGEHRLRDLSRAERVFQVCAAGLATEFPALVSLDAFPQEQSNRADPQSQRRTTDRIAGARSSVMVARVVPGSLPVPSPSASLFRVTRTGTARGAREAGRGGRA